MRPFLSEIWSAATRRLLSGVNAREIPSDSLIGCAVEKPRIPGVGCSIVGLPAAIVQSRVPEFVPAARTLPSGENANALIIQPLPAIWARSRGSRPAKTQILIECPGPAKAR